MSGRAGRTRSLHFQRHSKRTLTILRRFGIPIGKDGRLYAAYRQYGADWKAGELITSAQARQIVKHISDARAAELAAEHLESVKERADAERIPES
jgi:hypothetical protein